MGEGKAKIRVEERRGSGGEVENLGVGEEEGEEVIGGERDGV